MSSMIGLNVNSCGIKTLCPIFQFSELFLPISALLCGDFEENISLRKAS